SSLYESVLAADLRRKATSVDLAELAPFDVAIGAIGDLVAAGLGNRRPLFTVERQTGSADGLGHRSLRQHAGSRYFPVAIRCGQSPCHTVPQWSPRPGSGCDCVGRKITG